MNARVRFEELGTDSSTRPLVVRAASAPLDVVEWVGEHGELIERTLLERGAILLRDFTVSEEAFRRLAPAVFDLTLEYIYRSTPRSTLGGGLYTATEYPPKLTIPLHNENAYQRDWPMKLMFFCAEPAATGGETTLADMKKVTEAIPRDLVAEFEARRVLYVRNYHKHLDLSWQTVFQATQKAEVEAYCARHEIAFEWPEDDRLRTRQVCQGVATHPRTAATLWFNQAHLFHVSNLDAGTQKAMRSLLREEDFPRNAFFGDGAPIPITALDAIRQAFQQHAVGVRWQQGDVLILDNMLVAHGRLPFQGTRRVLVSMGDPFSASHGATGIERDSRAKP